MRSITSALFAGLLLVASSAQAQWAKRPDPAVPRMPDGMPNLNAPARKASDGTIDLSGVWLVDADPTGKPEGVEDVVFPRYFVNVAADLKPEDVAMEPGAAGVFKQRLQGQGKDAPSARCMPAGVPRAGNVPLPFKIVQTPRLVLILHEEDTVFRQVFLDGRTPVADAQPRWMGYSVGRWDGDALVVETTGFNDRTWLDGMGHPHTDVLHVTERFRRRDVGHLDVQVTIDDAKTYKKPLAYTQHYTLVADDDLLEYFCSENEKDVEHIK